MLFRLEIDGNCGSQIDELITKNLEMLDTADTARLKDKDRRHVSFVFGSCYHSII